jgi:hypothetical protein
VVDKILSEPWAPSVEIGREVPEAKFQDDCVVSKMCTVSWAANIFPSFRNVTAGSSVIFLRADMCAVARLFRVQHF